MESKVKSENFIVIQGWMINELELKGNDIIPKYFTNYAIILFLLAKNKLKSRFFFYYIGNNVVILLNS